MNEPAMNATNCGLNKVQLSLQLLFSFTKLLLFNKNQKAFR